MILTSISHERIFWVIIFGVIIFKKPKVIQTRVTNITKVRKHFFKSPRAPYNFRFNNNEKSEKETNKKHTNCLQGRGHTVNENRIILFLYRFDGVIFILF